MSTSCIDSYSASVSFSGELQSSGSSDSAVISLSGAFSESFAIASSDWQKTKTRYKYAFMSSGTTLANGDYSLTVCATQSGSDGRSSKTTCSSFPFTVACAE